MKVKVESAYRLLHPRPVVLICSSYGGKVSFMACSWITPVNDEPVMIAAAIWEENYTHELIERSNEFTVNVPNLELAEKVWLAGKKSGRTVDKAKLTGLKLGKAKKVSVPIIEDCIANLECVVRDRAKAGDHTVYIAEVVEAYVEEDLFETVWREKARILMHVGGRIFSTSCNFFEVR